jgi:hypothetical protein
MLHEVVGAENANAAVDGDEGSAAPRARERAGQAADDSSVDGMRQCASALKSRAAAPEEQTAVGACARAVAGAGGDSCGERTVGQFNALRRVPASSAPLPHGSSSAGTLARRAERDAGVEAT